METYAQFSNWLDRHLANDLPKDIVAVNFNLYEGAESTYDVELVGCNSFDEGDSDWACDEVYTTRDDLFYIQRTSGIKDWKKGLKLVAKLVKLYLKKGKYADKLKSCAAVAIGFVDGNIKILYRSK
jgi:hypothetical protein